METNDIKAGLLSEETLVRRGYAKLLSDMAESDPNKIKEGDIETIVSILRKEEDTITMEHLLEVIGFIAGANSSSLIKAGLLRTLIDIFIKNMSGVGIYAGRDAMRLISAFAPADPEAVEKLGVVRLVVRAFTGSTDPYIRWYALMGLRRINPSLIQREAEAINEYSINAIAKDNDEETRIHGASTLMVIASVAPQAFGETNIIKTLIDALRKDPSKKVQGCIALALNYIAKDATLLLKDSKIGEVLLETMTNKLEALKSVESKEDLETLTTVASTISLLALKDARILSGGRATEEIIAGEAIASVLEERQVEGELRSILLSALLNLSERGPPHYLNSRKMGQILINQLEKSKERDSTYRSLVMILKKTASTFPTLFGEAKSLEQLVTMSLKGPAENGEKVVRREFTPLAVLDALAGSEKGLQVMSKGFSELYEEKPSLIEDLCALTNWQTVLEAVKKKQRLEAGMMKVKVPTVPSVLREPEERPAEKEKMLDRGPSVVRKKAAPKPYKMNDEQRKMLSEVFRTQSKVSLSELANKLSVDAEVLKDALQRLIQSGRLNIRIENDVIYLEKKPSAPVETAAKEARRVVLEEGKPAFTCFWCGAAISPKDQKCAKCGKLVPRCLICGNPLRKDDQLQRCPLCGSAFHAEHYTEWVELKKQCPKCRVEWYKIK